MKTTRLWLIVIFTALILTVPFKLGDVRHRLSAWRSHPSAATPPSVPAIVRSLRPNYPYSVIPGGVYSPAELRRDVEKDPVVRSHYAGFDTRAARLVVATYDRFQYASYRMNGQIYWTKHKLRIPKGEILITDGKNLARTRCGNRLSESPQFNAALSEPDLKDLSLPPFSMDLLKEGPLTFAAPPPSEISELPERLSSSMPPPADVEAAWPPMSALLPISMPVPGIAGTPTVKESQPGSPAAPGGSYPSPPSSSPLPLTPAAPPSISEVPEPGALSLFAMFLVASAWGLSRIRRAKLAPARKC